MARPVETDAAKIVCDMLVWYGVFKCVIGPMMAIFRGELYGPLAFVAGAVIISSCLFGELYFRDQD